MAENIAFTERCIKDILKHDSPPVGVVTEYLVRVGRIAWDECRGLFWVNHPSAGWQVAVWLMDQARLLKKDNTDG